MPFINNFAFGMAGSAVVAGVQAAQTATVDFADTIPVMTTQTNTTLTGEGVRPEGIADHEISVYTDQETKDSGLSYEERHCLDGIDGPHCDSRDGSGEDVWSPLFIRDAYNNTRAALNNTIGGTGPSIPSSSFMRKRHGDGASIPATGAEVLTESSNNFDFGLYDNDDDDAVEVQLAHLANEEDEDETDGLSALREEGASIKERSGAAAGAGGEVDEAPVYPWEVPACSTEESETAKRLEAEMAFFHGRGTSTWHPKMHAIRFQEGGNNNKTEAELLDADYYLHKETSIFDELDLNSNLMREAFTLLIAAISTALVLLGRRAPAKAKHAVY